MNPAEPRDEGDLQIPMTDPWDERYTYRSMNGLPFYGNLVGKYTIVPWILMDFVCLWGEISSLLTFLCLFKVIFYFLPW